MKEIERIITSHEEAIKDGWIDVKESDEDWNDFVKLVQYARSTLTPPDTQGALDAPDLESLKRKVINAVQSTRHNELSIDAGSAISEAIDHLAPRIVREGYKVTGEIIYMAMYADKGANWNANECQEIWNGYVDKVNAMIAASKGD